MTCVIQCCTCLIECSTQRVEHVVTQIRAMQLPSVRTRSIESRPITPATCMCSSPPSSETRRACTPTQRRNRTPHTRGLQGGLVLSEAVKECGILKVAASAIEDATDGLPLWQMNAIFCALVLVCTTFVSHTVGAMVILPVVASVGAAMPDPHPRLLVMATALMCSGAMGLPVSGALPRLQLPCPHAPHHGCDPAAPCAGGCVKCGLLNRCGAPQASRT